MKIPLRHPVFILWLILFSWCAGRWVWLWWPTPAYPYSPPPSTQVADAGALVAASLFGTPTTAIAGPAGLRLIGVNTDVTQGFALIETNGLVRAWVRGDTLPDGQTIRDITHQAVLLEQAGRVESLPLQANSR